MATAEQRAADRRAADAREAERKQELSEKWERIVQNSDVEHEKEIVWLKENESEQYAIEKSFLPFRSFTHLTFNAEMKGSLRTLDHLPRLKHTNSQGSELQIPNIADPVYGNGGFLDFADRNGWQYARLLLLGDLGEHTKLELARLLLTWFFFGLIQEISALTQVPYDKKDFVCFDHRGIEYISTKRLPEYQQKWLTHLDSLSTMPNSAQMMASRRGRCDDFAEAMYRINSYVSMVGRFCSIHVNWKGRLWTKRLVWAPLALFLQLIGQRIDMSMTCMARAKGIRKSDASYVQCEWGESMDMTVILPLVGWCPARAATFRADNAIEVQYFASLMRPYGIGQVHAEALWSYSSSSQDASAAELCSSESCKIENVDEISYRTRHVEDGCDCEYLLIDSGRLSNILDQACDLIPIVVLSGDVSTLANDFLDPHRPEYYATMKLELDAVQPGTEYVCISHVWAHGLGNTTANSLPRCQVRRLWSTLYHLQIMALGKTKAEIPEKINLWIDTLCVPVGVAYRAARRKAIARMQEIYSRATCVLVLDAGLKQRSNIQMARDVVSDIEEYLHEDSIEEIIVRLSYSAWMGRLWTLQEAYLGQFVLIMIGEAVSSLEAITRKFADEDDELVTRCMNSTWSHIRTLLQLLSPNPTQTRHRKRPIDKLTALIEELRYRRTSKKEDEAVCLATMAGTDVEKILEARPSQRMETFWRLTTEVPSNVVFRAGRRLATPGFRWAPETLLATGMSTPASALEGARHVCTRDDRRGILWPAAYLSLLNNPVPQHQSTVDPSQGIQQYEELPIEAEQSPLRHKLYLKHGLCLLRLNLPSELSVDMFEAFGRTIISTPSLPQEGTSALCVMLQVTGSFQKSAENWTYSCIRRCLCDLYHCPQDEFEVFGLISNKAVNLTIEGHQAKVYEVETTARRSEIWIS